MKESYKKILSGSIFRLSLFSINIVVAFFIMPFIIHSIGDRMYGFWNLVGYFIGFYGLLDLGLTGAVSRYIAGSIGENNPLNSNYYINTSLFLFSIIGVIIIIISVIIALFSFSICDNPADADLFMKTILILGISTGISFPVRSFKGILTALLRFDLLSIFQLVTLILRTGLIYYYLNRGYGVLALSVITFITSLFEMILIIYFAFKKSDFLKLRVKYIQGQFMKKLFSYSIFSFIAKITDQLRFNIDGFVITAFIGLEAVTIYAIASQIIRYFSSLMISIIGVIQPYFSILHGRNKDDNIKHLFLFMTKISIYISCFVCFGFLLWGKQFIIRWIGVDYVESYKCLVILAASTTIAMMQLPSVNLIYATSKHKFYSATNSIEGITNLILSLILVKPFGIVGIALGTALPMALIKILIQPYYICKILKIQRLFYYKMVLKNLLVVILSLVVPYFISINYIKPDYFILIINAILSFILYIIFIYTFGFNKAEKRYFFSFIKPFLIHM